MKHLALRLELLKMAKSVLEENHKSNTLIAKAAVERAVSIDQMAIRHWENHVPIGYSVADIISAATELEKHLKNSPKIGLIDLIKIKIQLLIHKLKRK